jgi:PAS domain S-box-containing protein
LIIGILLTNINKRRIAENSLRKSEERFRGVFENSAIGIFKSDSEGNYLLANPAFISMLGFDSFNDFKERNYLVEDSTREKIEQDIINHFKNSDELKGYEVLTSKKDGSEIYLRLNIRRVSDENNEQILEGFAEDITESKKAEKAMNIAKEQAIKSDQLKTEFLAQMSHEIRTPINTILSFASLLRDTIKLDKDDDLYDSFQIIDRAGKRIIRTVNLLLDMSQIQTGTFETNHQIVNISKEVLEPLFLEFYKIAKDKGIELIFTSQCIDDEINADEYTAMQIFHNLIDNAIKYTDKGTIKIIAYNPPGKDKICVDIQDSGIGISKEYLPFLFQPFTQEEQGYTRKFEGNGLGLALVKRYCEIVKAKVSVESEKGTGTTFTITFDIKNPDLPFIPHKK